LVTEQISLDMAEFMYSEFLKMSIIW